MLAKISAGVLLTDQIFTSSITPAQPSAEPKFWEQPNVTMPGVKLRVSFVPPIWTGFCTPLTVNESPVVASNDQARCSQPTSGAASTTTPSLPLLSLKPLV